MNGLTASVTPYDVNSGGACTDMPVEVNHSAMLTFGRPGIGEIEFRGRDGAVQRTVVVK